MFGADAYTAASGGSDDGYPVFQHMERVVDGGVIWAPAIAGALLPTTTGGFTFRLLTTEAYVVLYPEKTRK